MQLYPLWMPRERGVFRNAQISMAKASKAWIVGYSLAITE